MTLREIRQRAGLSQDRAAVAADTTAPTVRLYELARDDVKPAKRAALDAVYCQLAARLGVAFPFAESSASPSTAAAPTAA